jgi:hypothetical protein
MFTTIRHELREPTSRKEGTVCPGTVENSVVDPDPELFSGSGLGSVIISDPDPANPDGI